MKYRQAAQINLPLAALILLLALMTAQVDAQTYALSLKPGTLGITLEASRSFGPNYSLRAGYSYLSYSHSLDSEEEYVMDADLAIGTASLIFDWSPNGGIFHTSLGLMYNRNEVSALLTPKEDQDVGGRIYTPAMLGTLSADIGFNRVSPYIGFGFGNADGEQSGFTFDIGVLYHGPPKVGLEANGLLEPSTEQAPVIESNLEWFSIYPLVSIGYIYKF